MVGEYEMKYMVFVTLLLFTAMLVLPVSATSPEITTWYNDKTSDSNLDITINTSESIKFNVTANQSIDAWNWSIDDSNILNNNYDNFSKSWDTPGTINVSVNATNTTNGTSSTITWKVTVKEPVTITSPEIISWCNNETNDDGSDITININETIKFNVTANQIINTWNWSIDGDVETNNYDNFTTSWATEGVRNVSVNATNSNGTSNTIIWEVTVKNVTENGIILSHTPDQIVDYIYVNDTISETITYSITTAEPMDDPKWTVDGKSVTGTESGNTYSYTHTWDNESIDESPYKIIFTGSYDDSQVEFKWYVNVYEIGDYSGGRHLFGIIDDALKNHATDVQIRMIKRHRVSNSGNGYVAQKVDLLHDEIDKRQSTRAALRDDFKSRKISNEEYVAAQQQAQLDAKYNQKLLKELEKNMTISKSNNGKGNKR